jgi:hypothetical protein
MSFSKRIFLLPLTPERQFAIAEGTSARNWLPLTPSLLFCDTPGKTGSNSGDRTDDTGL